jgi:putative flippase GtrA
MILSFIRTALTEIDDFLYSLISRFLHTDKSRQTGHEFVKFAILGVFNTMIDFGIYTLLTRHTAFFDYHKPTKYLANAISFLIATTFSFYANRTWTFGRTDKPSMGEAARFYTTTLSGLLINSGVLFIGNQIFSINDLLAKVFSTIFSTIWNFTFKKFWVFVPEGDDPPNNAIQS